MGPYSHTSDCVLGSLLEQSLSQLAHTEAEPQKSQARKLGCKTGRKADKSGNFRPSSSKHLLYKFIETSLTKKT